MNLPDPIELLARADFILTSVDKYPEARDLPVTAVMRELVAMCTMLLADSRRYKAVRAGVINETNCQTLEQFDALVDREITAANEAMRKAR